MKRLTLAGALSVSLLIALLGAAPAAAAAPAWKLTVRPSVDYFVPGPGFDSGFYIVEAENAGTAPTSDAEQITLQDVLPPGLVAEEAHLYSESFPVFTFPWRTDLSSYLCPTPVECQYPGSFEESTLPPLQPHQRLVMEVRVGVPSGTPSGPVTDLAKVKGGGAARVAATAANQVDPEPPLGFDAFEPALSDSSGNAYVQAGGHPYQMATEIDLTSKPQKYAAGEAWGTGGALPVADPKDINGELPPGVIGNPQGVPHCSLADFFSHSCPIGSVVGYVGIRDGSWAGGVLSYLTALYNLQPAGAYPGELGYYVVLPFLLTAHVRSGSDYGLTITSAGIPEVGLTHTRVVTWGVPADPSHDALRGKTCAGGATGGFWSTRFTWSIERIEHDCEAEKGFGDYTGGPAEVPPVPFLTMPTSCPAAPLAWEASFDSWESPGVFADASATTPATDGCNQLSFEPEIEARPTTTLADAPSGLDLHLKVPQNEDPEGTATADLKEASIKLPQGLTVNPASANGLTGCTEAEVGLLTAQSKEESAHCPDASKLGLVTVHTPLLNEPLEGALYLAAPHRNPFGSLLAAYLVLEGQGLIFKLPGEIEADPQTGQLTTSFRENPQLPFEDLELKLFEGAGSPLRTPATCGTYTTTSVLTPYSAPESGPPAEPTASFETSNGGGPCPNRAAEEPNAPVFRAGTESPLAGAYSPFSLRLARADGSQEFSKVETTLPEGLVGRLAGLAECPDAAIAAAEAKSGEAELASASCPASSEVGTVEVASGAGPTPLYVKGRAYLAGPYKGAPLSLAIVTPAVAGPFDLGDVVVRTALYVDPFSARIKAVSDPIPHIIQGIPLDIRSVTLAMNRPDFTLNPTDCEELHLEGSETSLLGAVAPLSQRFQVGGCQALPFKPKLAIRLKGATRRSGFPALTATLKMPAGDANVAAAQVTLPHSAFLAQGHIQKTCGRPELASHTCPASSIYGHARAVSPLLDHPLEGPVYLATGFGYRLPALVADLNGQIEVQLVGKVDTGREDGIRNTFEVVPDAPVSSFTLQMLGGKKGLIENHEDLCAKHAKRKALARFSGQNGKVVELEPTVANSCKQKGRGKKRGGGGHSRGRRMTLFRGW